MLRALTQMVCLASPRSFVVCLTGTAVDVSYQYLRFFLEDDAELAQIREDYRTGKMLTGEIKKRCAEELAKYCTAFQERRAKVNEDTVDLFMARRPLVWAGAESLKSLPVRPAEGAGAPAEGGDGKMTKNQLKKLEKQKQIEEKKAKKAQEKEAAKATAEGA